MPLAKTLIAGFVILVLVKAGNALRRGLASLGQCPSGGFYWFHPLKITAVLLAPIFPFRGWLGHYSGRFSLYATKGSTILSGLWVWQALPVFWVADPEGLKAITSDRHTFPKDENVVSDHIGKSLLSTDGDEWRRHIAVAGPAFSDSTSELAWEETLRLMNEWFSDELDKNLVDSGPDAQLTVDILAKTTQLSLHVIAAAGFGMRAPWATFSDTQQSRSLSMDEILPFHAALGSTLINLPVRVLVPRFLFSLPFRIPWLSDKLSAAQHSFDCTKVHISNLVNSARREGDKTDSGILTDFSTEDHIFAEKRANLLRRLVEANESGGESGGRHKGSLTDDELFSNIFTFLIAGHETVAHTLAFSILLLALYPNVQIALREDSYRVWPTDDDAKNSSFKEDFEKLVYTLAVFRETLRCFPPVPRLVKVARKDAVITGLRFHHAPRTPIRKPNSTYDGATTHVQFERDESREERTTVSVPEGSLVIMDFWALHMNPLVWGSDAHEFRPERFIDTEDCRWPREGFFAFSSGLRTCIGQRFALAEAVCTLANLVRHYEILPVVDRQRFTSDEEFKRVMMGHRVGHTIAPATKCVKFGRLDKAAT